MQGERVRTRLEQVAAVVAIKPRPPTAWVYNLEVAGEHVYEVGPSGVLVHNACEVLNFRSFNEAQTAAIRWLKEMGFDPHKAKLTISRFTGEVNGMAMKGSKGKIGFRIEWDERTGAHINVFAGKTKGPHYAFPGNLKTVKSILRQLFKGARVPIE